GSTVLLTRFTSPYWNSETQPPGQCCDLICAFGVSIIRLQNGRLLRTCRMPRLFPAMIVGLCRQQTPIGDHCRNGTVTLYLHHSKNHCRGNRRKRLRSVG